MTYHDIIYAALSVLFSGLCVVANVTGYPFAMFPVLVLWAPVVLLWRRHRRKINLADEHAY